MALHAHEHDHANPQRAASPPQRSQDEAQTAVVCTRVVDPKDLRCLLECWVFKEPSIFTKRGKGATEDRSAPENTSKDATRAVPVEEEEN